MYTLSTQHKCTEVNFFRDALDERDLSDKGGLISLGSVKILFFEEPLLHLPRKALPIRNPSVTYLKIFCNV